MKTSSPPIQLIAGRIRLVYENGCLRTISLAETEILKMIYFAVRDRNWETVGSSIINEQIRPGKNFFTIHYDCLCLSRDLEMQWSASIEGYPDSSIEFSIVGRALVDMYTNRAGFCILHPVNRHSQPTLSVVHTDGTGEDVALPDDISPCQPIENIRSLRWKVNPDATALLEMQGDVFEMEDHRNWTDNSFKTYGRPLALPHPFLLQRGSEIRQRISFRITGGMPAETPDKTQVRGMAQEIAKPTVQLRIDEDRRYRIPLIGVGRSGEVNAHYPAALKWLSGVGFDHYRVDIRLDTAGWTKKLEAARREAKMLGCQLELALFVLPDSGGQWLDFLAADIPPREIANILVLPLKSSCTGDLLFNAVVFPLKKKFPGVPIGCGTDRYFAELNRSGLSSPLPDFMVYSINPQVHAFDDATLVENTEAQGFTVESAIRKFKKPVYVSPVTLKKRYNADALEDQSLLPPLSDPRQSSLFCAGWTLASLKYLIENQVSSITYFELTGSRGLADEKTLAAYPILEVFKNVCGKEFTHTRKISSSEPFSCSALLLCSETRLCYCFANHLPRVTEITIVLPPGDYSKQALRDNGHSDISVLRIESASPTRLILQAHGVLFLRKDVSMFTLQMSVF